MPDAIQGSSKKWRTRQIVFAANSNVRRAAGFRQRKKADAAAIPRAATKAGAADNDRVAARLRPKAAVEDPRRPWGRRERSYALPGPFCSQTNRGRCESGCSPRLPDCNPPTKPSWIHKNT